MVNRMIVYCMGMRSGTSKNGKDYAVLELLDEQGRRQSFFLGQEQYAALEKRQKEVLSPSLTDLKPLEADIDPFTSRLINLEPA